MDTITGRRSMANGLFFKNRISYNHRDFIAEKRVLVT